MNEVQICNMALDRLGMNAISSMTEATKEARTCNRHYDLQRDALLRSHDWGFAKKEIALALLTATHSGWDYAYAYPVDCLKPREIYNAQDPSRLNSAEVSTVNKDPILYEVRSNTAGSSKVILTDEEDAVLIYTARIENCNAFDSLFVELLVLKMAEIMAWPLTKNAALKKEIREELRLLLPTAAAIDAEESENDENDSGSFVRARA